MAKLAESHKQLVIDCATIKEESTYDRLDAEYACFVKGGAVISFIVFF